MDDDSDGLPTSPTVSSILGIKGPLRFRPHGSSQKAHIILRRVELSDDSDDDGSAKPIVYFSLFAQKRIEVKPGKEILLAVSDSKYKDQPVIFEGDLPGKETSSDEEDGAEINKKVEIVTLPSRDILPPKMRRTWTKRVSEQVSPMNSSPPPAPPGLSYTSIAVQAEPTCVMASAQTVAPLPRLRKSLAAQTIEVTQNVSNAMVQTDPVIPVSSHKNGNNATSPDDEVGSTRSLSPMELDSPSSMPQSPAANTSVDTCSKSNLASLGIDLPVLSSNDVFLGRLSRSVASGGEEKNLRPIKSLVRPIPTGPDILRPLTPARGVMNGSSASVPSSVLVHIPHVEPRELQPPSQSPIAGPVESVALRTTASTVADATCRNKAVSPASSVTPKRSVSAKRKPFVVNPFVSGGFVTEFGGSTKTAKTPEPIPIVTTTPQPSVMKPLLVPGTEDPPRATSASPMEESPISAVKVEIFSPCLNTLTLPSLDSGSNQKAGSLSPMEQSPVSSTSSTPPRLSNGKPEIPCPYKVLPHSGSPRGALITNTDDSPSSLPSRTESASTSVSVSLLSRISLPHTVTRSPIIKTEPMVFQIPKHGPRNPMQTQSKARHFVNSHPLPPKPIQSSRTSSTSRDPRYRPSPPPDPRSIAYVSSGPSSNPLGIRPSSRPSRQRTFSRATASGTPSTSTARQKNKKPIIVGSGWPYTRATGGLNSIPSAPSYTSTTSTQGSRTQVITSEPKPHASQPPSHDPISFTASKPPATLNNILLYSSPSPPSASLQPNTVNGPQPSKSGPVSDNNTRKNVRLSSNGRPVNGRPVSSEAVGSKVSTFNAIKTEPLDDQLPPDPHFLSASQNDRPYSLIFDFTDPPPLSPSKSKARDAIPKGPRKLETDRLANQPTVASNSTTKRTLNGSAPQKQKINGTSTHSLAHKPLPISRREADQHTRGIKRGVSPVLQETKVFRPPIRSFRWPVVESTHRVRVKGDDGDVSIKGIAFSSDGSQFVVNCNDRTIRIWNNRNHTEVARLAHNSPVVSVAWMQGDAGIVSLCEDGIVSKWIRTGQNHWQWAKIVDAGTEHRQDDEAICFAYMYDRIAIAFPKLGVKVWQWIKGTWQAQRSILRQNVTSIQFVEDGRALLGGTRDGVLWYCEVPNGTLRAYAFLKSKVYALDVNPFGSQALVAQTGGRAHLVSVNQIDRKGTIEQVYAIKEENILSEMTHEFGALFANGGRAVLYGSINGCVLVWDKSKGNIVCGLDHCEDDIIQAIAVFDHNTASTNSSLITGTKQGLLNWWSQPSMSDIRTGNSSNKRVKLSPQ